MATNLEVLLFIAYCRVFEVIEDAADYHRNAYRRNNRIRWALVMGSPISQIDLDGTHKDLGGMETVPPEALINFKKATAQNRTQTQAANF